LDADSRDVERERHSVAHEDAAARHSLLPGEAEFCAVDHRAGLEAHTLVAPWVLAGALDDSGQCDLVRVIPDRKVADNAEHPALDVLYPPRLECDLPFPKVRSRSEAFWRF
jgi:hypothetical protein